MIYNLLIITISQHFQSWLNFYSAFDCHKTSHCIQYLVGIIMALYWLTIHSFNSNWNSSYDHKSCFWKQNPLVLKLTSWSFFEILIDLSWWQLGLGKYPFICSLFSLFFQLVWYLFVINHGTILYWELKVNVRISSIKYSL